MATELVEVAPRGTSRMIRQDSEFDDALAVPDSLEITVDENGKMIQVRKEEREFTDKGTNLYSAERIMHAS